MGTLKSGILLHFLPYPRNHRPDKKAATMVITPTSPPSSAPAIQTIEYILHEPSVLISFPFYLTCELKVCSTKKPWNSTVPLALLRFVLVEMNGTQSILTSTCLELDPLSIIRLYSYRFRIECMFREEEVRGHKVPRETLAGHLRRHGPVPLSGKALPPLPEKGAEQRKAGRKGDILPPCAGSEAGPRGWLCGRHRDGIHRERKRGCKQERL